MKKMEASNSKSKHLAKCAENARANASPLLSASSVPPSLATACRTHEKIAQSYTQDILVHIENKISKRAPEKEKLDYQIQM